MNFKKTAALLLSLSIVGVSVAACSNEPEPVSSDVNVIATQDQNSGSGESDAPVAAATASENFVFKYAGVDLIVNTDIDDSKFSDDDYEVSEVASCAGQGLASLYSFKNGSFSVETMVGADTIVRIALVDDTVTTAEGVYIGQTIDDVKAVYGEPAESSETLYIYTKGTSELRFQIDGNGKVTEIDYFAAGIL